MSGDVVRSTVGFASEAERRAWVGPVLGSWAPSRYAGHVVSDVWADGFVSVIASAPLLIPAALAALASRPSVSTVAAAPVLQDPLTMTHPEAQFLGHVIVEFVVGAAPVVGVVGSDNAAMLQLTENRLRELASKPLPQAP
jgi:hypothetical protein